MEFVALEVSHDSIDPLPRNGEGDCQNLTVVYARTACTLDKKKVRIVPRPAAVSMVEVRAARINPKPIFQSASAAIAVMW